MKKNKYLEEVWEWKEKLSAELEGLSIKEISEKINKKTEQTVNFLKLRCIQPQEKIKL